MPAGINPIHTWGGRVPVQKHLNFFHNSESIEEIGKEFFSYVFNSVKNSMSFYGGLGDDVSKRRGAE